MTLDDLCDPAALPAGEAWNDEGVVVLPQAIPAAVMRPYELAWKGAHGWRKPKRVPTGAASLLDADEPRGWASVTPYMDEPTLLDLCTTPVIALALEGLLGEPAGLHLNLTGWISTERNWHQDAYLNTPEVGNSYAAVWIALGTIHTDAGPFQYVPGSHLWPVVTQEKMLAALRPEDHGPMWPKASERILTPLWDEEIDRRKAEVVTYLPKRGDVLIWHSRLVHRGTLPRVPGAARPALIAHFSGITHRPDMPPAQPHGKGWFFPLTGFSPGRPA